MSILLVTIDSAIFRHQNNYAVSVQVGSSSQRSATSDKTVSPIFNQNCFQFQFGLQDYLQISVHKHMGGSFDLAGQSQKFQLSGLSLYMNQSLTHSITIASIEGSNVGCLNLTLEITDQQEYADMRLRSLSEKHASNEIDPIQREPLDQNLVWHLQVHVKSAEGIPLDPTMEHGLPSSKVQIAWSPTEQFEQHNPTMTRHSSLKTHTATPNWNEQLSLKGDATTEQIGFVFVRLLSEVDLQLDAFSIPLSFFKLYKPICLRVSLLKGLSTIYLTCGLETIRDRPLKSLDSIVKFCVRSAQFDQPPKTLNPYSLMLARQGLKAGTTVPFFNCDTRDDQSFSRAFYEFSQDSQVVFLGPAQSYRNTAAPLACKLLRTTLDQPDLCLYLVGQGEQHSSALEVVASSAIISPQISSQLSKDDAATTLENVVLSCGSDSSSLCKDFAQTQCWLEFSAYQLGWQDFVQAKSHTGEVEPTQQQALPDFFDEKERWQVLSRELSQKQELIQATSKKTLDIERQIQEKGTEMTALRLSIRHMQTKVHAKQLLAEQEDQIESETSVSQDILSLNLGELRKELVQTSLSFKSELFRNHEFEEKLEAALRQLDRKSHIYQELQSRETECASLAKKHARLTKEHSREQAYRVAIEKQEQVISRLQDLLEQAIANGEKQQFYKGGLSEADVRIAQIQSKLNQRQQPAVDDGAGLQIERLQQANQALREKIVQAQTEVPAKQTSLNSLQERKGLEYQIKIEAEKAGFFESELQKSDQQFETEIAKLTELLHSKQSELDRLSNPTAAEPKQNAQLHEDAAESQPVFITEEHADESAR